MTRIGGAGDLFCIDQASPTKCGLVRMLGAGRIVEIDRESATIEKSAG